LLLAEPDAIGESSLGIALRGASSSPALLLLDDDDDGEPERLALLPARDELLPGKEGGAEEEGNEAVDGELGPEELLLGIDGAELVVELLVELLVEAEEGAAGGDGGRDDADAEGIDELELLLELEEELCCSKQPLSDRPRQTANTKGRTVGFTASRKRPAGATGNVFAEIAVIDVEFLR
jgi:hypothetical protein